MPVSQEEYINSSSHCPFCGSTEINAGHMEVDGKDAWCKVECDNCGAQWQDNYKLTGYEVV